ncbi:MAG: hypothetical protein ACK4SY_04740 [Pyrobaculum sp.]
MDIILEEVRKVFGSSDEGRLVESLVVAYREGGTRAARAVLVEYLKAFGIDVEDKQD